MWIKKIIIMFLYRLPTDGRPMCRVFGIPLSIRIIIFYLNRKTSRTRTRVICVRFVKKKVTIIALFWI